MKSLTIRVFRKKELNFIIANLTQLNLTYAVLLKECSLSLSASDSSCQWANCKHTIR